jgi:acetate kinase
VCPEPAATCALLASDDPRCKEALDLLAYRAGRELGSLAAAMSGIDALVFTGGIGENAAAVREGICRAGQWLGLRLDTAANNSGQTRISTPDSQVSAWVIPTNEELMIARQVFATLAGAPARQ